MRPNSTGRSNVKGEEATSRIEVDCPHCKALLGVDSIEAGKTAKCPHCEGLFHIPVPHAQIRYTTKTNEQNYPDDYRAFVDKKMAAGICAMVLGAFGIHKFIIGLNSAGTTMLLVYLACLVTGSCLVVPILGCLALTVIGFVEGVLYITKTDEEFYQTYAVQKQEWF